MDLLEKLAALEHEQWSHWTEYMLENMTPGNIERWKIQMNVPYHKLSNQEQVSDREWALKVLEIFKDELNKELRC